MKSLANCKPSEFLKQTNRIKKSAEKWLTVTDIMSIRQTLPDLIEPDADADIETKAKVYAENKRRKTEQAKKNLSKILDAMLEEHPDETLELLALLCFVEPKDVDNYPMSDYLVSISEMISDPAVVGFFTSFQRLAQMDTSDA